MSSATFHFWSRDVHPVHNMLLCTKFHENRMIFNWDMAIYRFSKWRQSTILELFYHHTRPPTKSLLLAAAACQISCQSDTHIWRYSYFNFSHTWLESWNAYSGPQNGDLGDFGLPRCDYLLSRPQKAHPCVNPRLLSYQSKNPLRGLTCRRVDRKCDGHTDRQTDTHTHR